MRYLLTLLLAGCATVPESPKVQLIPIAVPCTPEIPPRPAFVEDSALKGMPEYTGTIAIWIERRTAIDHADKLRAILEGCK